MRVALINDYEVVLAGVRQMLAPHGDLVEVVEIDANTAVKQTVDIALYDTYGQDNGSMASVKQALRTHVVDKVVLYSWNFNERLVDRAMQSGVSGVLAKSLDAEQLAQALVAIANGHRVVSPTPQRPRDLRPDESGAMDWPGRETGLTMREAEMIALITQGLTNAEIAERTYLSPNSVKGYIKSAYRKMGFKRRAHAIAWGLEHGFSPDRSRQYL